MTVPALRWGVFGGTWVSDGERRPTLSPQSRRVLGVLLAAPGRSVPGERLVQPPDHATPEQIANTARVAVSRLRTALATVGAAATVVTTPAGYALDIDHAAVDHVRFSRLLRQSEAAEWPADALALVDRALVLWAGRPFADQTDDLADDPELSPLATALEEERRTAVDRRCLLAVTVGSAAIGDLEAAVADDPYRERRWEALMLAHYRAGDQRSAIDAFDRARRTLVDDLGIEPGPELQKLLSSILDQDPDLDWRPVRAQRRPAGAGATGRTTALLGRDDEVADLLDLLQRRRIVVITGYGGMGKSALAVEVAGHQSAQLGAAAWVVPVTPATDHRVVESIAATMGVSVHEPDIVGRVARHLDDADGLLVLDGCDGALEATTEAIADLLSRTASARFLLTSRVELNLTGAVTFALGPLATGTPEAPGPAARIAADAALIRPSRIREEWDLVQQICDKADGVPLALELLGAAFADGRPLDLPPAAGLDDAVAVATDSLPTESRYLLNVLRALPLSVGVRFLGELTDLGTAAVHRVVGPLVRSGLVAHDPSPVGTRVRLLDPVRDRLAIEPALEVVVVKDLQRTFSELARAASPSLIDAIDTEQTLAVDEEHELGLWLLQQLGDSGDALRLACDLVPVWRACSRHVDGRRVLERLEPSLADATPYERALYWARRAQMSPSLADRAPLVPRLREAMEVASSEGDEPLRLRVGADLTIGLAWSGEGAEAAATLSSVRAAVSPDERWAALTLRTLSTMGRSLAGDPRGATIDMLEQADEYAEVGHNGEVANAFYVASAFARLAGDDDLLDRVLATAESLDVDRFSAYPMAGLAFERARRAMELDPDDAAVGPLLWEAFGQLQAHGERRAAATCRRELGTWRTRHGDPAGCTDLAVAALDLATTDPPAAAVAIVRLVDATGNGLEVREREGLRALAARLAGSSAGLPLGPTERAELNPPVPRPHSPPDERPTPEDHCDESQQWEILERLGRATTP